jgi:hypothetical protein
VESLSHGNGHGLGHGPGHRVKARSRPRAGLVTANQSKPLSGSEMQRRQVAPAIMATAMLALLAYPQVLAPLCVEE